MNWKAFCIEHGAYMPATELAFIVGQPVAAITRLREGFGKRASKLIRSSFADVFMRWHGRAPLDHEWPAPRSLNRRGSGHYEWQPPELALLASIVGTLDKTQIAHVLTKRLRETTGDRQARRTPMSVLNAVSRIGLQLGDVVGGISPVDAGDEIGTPIAVYKAIDRGELPVNRVGKHLVIPRDAWTKWKSVRTLIPDGYVRLSSIREDLAVRSDKLSEFARMGYVPTAVQCNLYGANGKTTQGVWYIAPETARALIADRRSGRAMPWHGKPILDNLRGSYRKWQEKRHADCQACRDIWGKDGQPATFEDYCARYPALSFGAKRHLTFTFKPSLSVETLANEARCNRQDVSKAIRNGVLRAAGSPPRITRIDATRWIARKKPTGDSEKSWIARETANKWYCLDNATLDAAIAAGKVHTRRITNGPKYGQIFVSRQQCRELRDEIGFTIEQVAQKLQLTVERVREILQGLDWRGGDRVAPAAVDAIEKRMAAKHGLTVESVAQRLGKPAAWVRSRIEAGLVKTRRARWHPDRQILSERTVEELRAIADVELPDRIPRDWVYTQGATKIAGVSNLTLNKWVDGGTLPFRSTPAGRMYDPTLVRARAAQYWAAARHRRGGPPAWLSEQARA